MIMKGCSPQGHHKTQNDSVLNKLALNLLDYHQVIYLKSTAGGSFSGFTGDDPRTITQETKSRLALFDNSQANDAIILKSFEYRSVLM